MRTALEELCPSCRLRLTRGTSRCPFCGRPTVGRDERDRQRHLARFSWELVLPGRAVRWVVLLLGALLVFPTPLVIVAVPVLTIAFGAPSDRVPGELILNAVIAGPGLFLALVIVGSLLVVAAAIPIVVPFGIVDVLRHRHRVEPCVRDAPLRSRSRVAALERWLERLRWRLKDWRKRLSNGKVFAIAAGGLAALLVAVSFALRDEDLLPWSAALVGVFGVVIVSFAGSLWFGVVLTSLDWLTRGAGLARKGSERGRRGFDPKREAKAMVAAWTADREPRTGTVDGRARVTAPLGGDEVLAFRIRGRVGKWAIDDACVADSLTLHTDAGAEVQVRAGDWAVLDEPGEPVPVPMTEALRSLLERLGVPLDDDVVLAEAVIRSGDRVTIHGDPSDALAPGRGYRDELGTVLTDATQRPLVLTRSA